MLFMASSWLKYCLALVISVPLLSVVASYGQPKIEGNDKCVISYLAGSANELKRDVKNEKPPVELGKIDISSITEGTEINKTYRIPNTQLRILVELLFDDDLNHDLGEGKSVPANAMTLWLTVWNGPKRDVKTILAATSNQASLDHYFFRSITSTYARKGPKMYFILADCTRNLEEENDK